MSSEPLDDMDDEELGQLVRQTAAFRAAAACARFSDEARELQKNDSLAFKRLVDETHAQQSTSVSVRDTTRDIIESFINVVEEHAELANNPEDAAEDAATDVIGETEV